MKEPALNGEGDSDKGQGRELGVDTDSFLWFLAYIKKTNVLGTSQTAIFIATFLWGSYPESSKSSKENPSMSTFSVFIFSVGKGLGLFCSCSLSGK